MSVHADCEKAGFVLPCAFAEQDFASSMGHVGVEEDFQSVGLVDVSAVGLQSGCVCRDFASEKASVSAFWEEARRPGRFEHDHGGSVRPDVRIYAILHGALRKLTVSRCFSNVNRRDDFCQGSERAKMTLFARAGLCMCHGHAVDAPA